MTLEQCWHRVPGGTAAAAIGSARALSAVPDLRLVGVAALHRRNPPRAYAPPITVRHLPLPRPALYEAWHRLRRPAVERAVGRADVVHATTIAIPPRSAPLVVTIHDLAFVSNPEHFTKRGLRFFARGLELALEEADLVVCPSQATMRSCLEHGFARERLRVVPFGIDQARVAPDDVERVRRTYGLSDSYLLWVGTIEPRKNLRGLLEAFRRVNTGVELVLAGPEGWNEDVRALVSGRDGIKILGFVPPEDLGPLYAGAKVFCFPSLLEGFGLPVLEAMAHGTAVVTSRGTATEELAAGAGVLVDPYDPSSIASGVMTVLEDEGAGAEMVRAGRERAASYSWARSASLLLEAYREAASKA